ncbi:MAG TPA: ABC transporter ATP-binding protein [Anaerolineales bacterium]|nr:ABC transporter ATP-binding protein [Anaerolineales bacterium]
MSNSSQNQILIETHNLSRYFGGLKAVDGVDFRLAQGDFHSIIGPNGAGKTTFLNLISGALKPTHGKVIYKGRDITSSPPHRMAHLGIGRSYQITNLFPTLTVLENVRLAAQALGKDNFKLLTHYQKFNRYENNANQVISRVGLSRMAQTPVLSLPHGDKRRLELAMLLAQDPEVLLLDEPTAGLATEQVPEFMALVKQVSELGNKTIVLVEHNMSVVMSLSDRITVMHQGRLLAEGTPAEISANETVQSAYLGTLYEDLDELSSPGA